MDKVLDALTRVIDNYPGGDLYHEVTAAAREAMSEVDGATLTGYQDARRKADKSWGSGGDLRDYYPYVDAAGTAVTQVIREDLENDTAGLWHVVLADLLDLGSQEARETLGHHYLPEVGDVDADDFPPDGDDDGDGGGGVEIPTDFPVRPVKADQKATDPVTCGTCHRTWDNAVPTQWTPAPSGRCPFEYFH